MEKSKILSSNWFSRIRTVMELLPSPPPSRSRQDFPSDKQRPSKSLALAPHTQHTNMYNTNTRLAASCPGLICLLYTYRSGPRARFGKDERERRDGGGVSVGEKRGGSRFSTEVGLFLLPSSPHPESKNSNRDKQQKPHLKQRERERERGDDGLETPIRNANLSRFRGPPLWFGLLSSSRPNIARSNIPPAEAGAETIASGKLYPRV